MKVKAIALGFYKGTRIRPGTVFDVPEKMTGKWFVPVEHKADGQDEEPGIASLPGRRGRKVSADSE